MLRSELNRREFLKRGVALVSLGSVMPAVFVRAVFAEESRSSNAAIKQGRVLVVLQMAGGNDGLNTVVPFADGRYYDARPGLYVSEETVLRLNDRIGLHPSMTAMKGLWDEGQLAIIEGVGYPNPDRSHFRSMEIWHTANPDGVSYDGWLGRFLDITAQANGSLWRALSVGSDLSPSLASKVSYVPTLSGIDAYRLQTDPRHPQDAGNRLTAWTSLYAQAAAEPGYMPLLSNTGIRAHESSLELQSLTATYTPAVEYPQNALATGLKLVAQIITSGLGTGICYVTTGGFDTHAQQGNEHAALLKTLSDAIGAFIADVAAHGRAKDVTLMVWSEFGRRVYENGSAGTDHGTAGPMFIVGSAIRGGTYGAPSSLADLDNGDLRFTTDFRSVYATILEEWLETPSKDVLGQKFPTLGLFL